MLYRQRQEIDVGHLTWLYEVVPRGQFGIQDGDVIRPEGVSRMGAQAAQHRKQGARIARGVRVSGVAKDTQQTVLRDGAGGPVSVPDARKPVMRRFVVDVCRIRQSDQDVVNFYVALCLLGFAAALFEFQLW